MDSKKQQQGLRPRQASDSNRYSWQLPLDEPLGSPTTPKAPEFPPSNPPPQQQQPPPQQPQQRPQQQSYGRKASFPAASSSQHPSRYSYVNTPIELQNHPAYQFQRRQTEPVPQTPITPISDEPMSAFPDPSRHSQYGFQGNGAINKGIYAEEVRTGRSPYNIAPPQEPHPANFAPVVLDSAPRSHSNTPRPRATTPQPQSPNAARPAVSTTSPIQPSTTPQPQSPTRFQNHPASPQAYSSQQRFPMGPDDYQKLPVPPVPQSPMGYSNPNNPSHVSMVTRPDNDSDYTKPPISPGPIPLKGDRDDSLYPPSTPRQTYVPHSPISPKPQQQSFFSPEALPHQPGQIAHPNMDLSTSGSNHEWKHSLCACSGDCLTGLFCPCILHGKTAYRMSQRSAKKDPTDLLGWASTNTQCVLTAVTCGFQCLFPMILRTRIRHAYHLNGSVGSDFIQSCCCCCCTIVQSEREVADREGSARRYAGPGTGSAYQSPADMVYAPPPRG